MSRQPTGPPPPPAVQRLRIRYAKRGRLRFTSHRDFARAFERALRRADVPMAYSAGFSPHPKVSYAGAAPTGVASEAEYLEIALAETRDPYEVRRNLDAALPPGLDIVTVVDAEGSGHALADRIAASRWRIALAALTEPTVTAALDVLMARETATVERVMKDGRRTIDVRPAIVWAAVSTIANSLAAPTADGEDANTACAIIDLVVRHTTPATRPDDVLMALRSTAGLTTPVTPRVTRLAQGQLEDTPSGAEVRLLDPLREERGDAPDRGSTVGAVASG